MKTVFELVQHALDFYNGIGKPGAYLDEDDNDGEGPRVRCQYAIEEDLLRRCAIGCQLTPESALTLQESNAGWKNAKGLFQIEDGDISVSNEVPREIKEEVLDLLPEGAYDSEERLTILNTLQICHDTALTESNFNLEAKEAFLKAFKSKLHERFVHKWLTPEEGHQLGLRLSAPEN